MKTLMLTLFALCALMMTVAGLETYTMTAPAAHGVEGAPGIWAVTFQCENGTKPVAFKVVSAPLRQLVQTSTVTPVESPAGSGLYTATCAMNLPVGVYYVYAEQVESGPPTTEGIPMTKAAVELVVKN